MKRYFKYLDYFILATVLIFLFAVNFTPGTWLAGWDNLLPELDIWLNLKRSLTAVWQENQGLGLVGGMAHATDIIRQIIILPFVILLPNNLIRYLWHFSMLALGAFGILQFQKPPFNLKKWPLLFGSLFYLLNFGTIQYFWTPYEAFSTFWGFFPWLIFSFWRYLSNKNKKNFLFFVLANILAIPSFYVPTIFIVYLLTLAVSSLVYLKSKQFLNSLFKLYGVIFLVNLFWLLPFCYFLLTNINQSTSSTTNFMASEEIFLRNKRRGTIGDFLMLRGYYYDYPDGESLFMEPWVEHLTSENMQLLGQIIGGLSLVGVSLIIISFLKKHNRQSWKLGLVGIWFLGAIALLSATTPFEEINILLRNLPLVSQVFRAPFTKFIAPTAFSFALLITIALEKLISALSKIYRPSEYILLVLISLGLFIFSFPSFKGNIIYSKMRVKIPQEYQELFSFFKKQPQTSRIANFPQGPFWGWTYYRYGMHGSGFLWYGLNQPILDRNFDMWSQKNEQYYWETIYALQKQDLKSLEQIWTKYGVEFVIFDDNVYYPSEKIYARLSLSTKKMFAESKNLEKVASFGNIDVYRFNKQATFSNFRSLPSVYPTSFSHVDSAFNLLGDYLTVTNSPDYFFPFAESFTNRQQDKPEIFFKKGFEQWTLNRLKPSFLDENYSFRIPQNNDGQTLPANPAYFLKSARKIAEIEIKPEEMINPHICGKTGESSTINFSHNQETMRLEARDTALCVTWNNFNFFQEFKQPMIVQVEFEYRSQDSEWPQYCLWDSFSAKCLNNKELPKKGFSRDWTKLTEEYFLMPSINKIEALTFILDATGKNNLDAIDYRKVKIRFYSPVEDISKPNLISNYEFLHGSNLLSIIVPKLDSPYFIDNPLESNLIKEEAKSCNSYLKGEYNLETLNENGKNFIRLSSKETDSCYTWIYPDLPLDRAYLVQIEYRNQKGYPLLVTGLHAEEKYQFFNTKLTDQKDWQTASMLIPPYSDAAKGIIIHLVNLSLTENESINDLAGIEIVPLPWEFLQTPYFEKGELAKRAEKNPLDFSGQSWFYQVKTSGQTGYISMAQSYDKGWIALTDNFKLLDHYEINNWANGWKIEGNPEKIYIIFWPQILQFIGFGGLGLAMLLCHFYETTDNLSIV